MKRILCNGCINEIANIDSLNTVPNDKIKSFFDEVLVAIYGKDKDKSSSDDLVDITLRVKPIFIVEKIEDGFMYLSLDTNVENYFEYGAVNTLMTYYVKHKNVNRTINATSAEVNLHGTTNNPIHIALNKFFEYEFAGFTLCNGYYCINELKQHTFVTTMESLGGALVLE